MAEVLALRSALVPFAALLLVRCSMLYGSPPAEQCGSDVDCERQLGASGLTCDPEYRVCVPKAAADACESSQLCTEKNGGKSLCRAAGTACIQLQTAECPSVQGEWGTPNALFIGTIGAHRLRTSNGNPVPLLSAQRAERAIDLGLKEWSQVLPGGLPSSGRPFAIVHCNSNSDPDQVARVMEHLASSVKVQALIVMGDVERNAIVDRARQAEIPVLCTACVERARAAPASGGVDSWFMQPPLEDQAGLVARRTRDLEQQVRAERSLEPSSPIRVALVGQDSPGNQAFVGALRGLLRFNGDLPAAGQVESYLESQTPDPARQNIDAFGFTQRLVQFEPDILIAAMESDFARLYLPMIEQQWPAGRRRPFYLVTVQNRELGLLESLARSSDDLHLRLSGTAPLDSVRVARNREAFAGRFTREYAEPAEEAGSAYDAFYAAAYALAADDYERQLYDDFGRQFDAVQFAHAMAQLTAGYPIDVGPADMLGAGGYLLEAQSIDLAGSSSELNWDATTGGITADATSWCSIRNADGSLGINYDAGLHWIQATGRPEGSFACP